MRYIQGLKTLLVCFDENNEIVRKHYFVGEHEIKVGYEEDLMSQFAESAKTEIQNLILDITSAIEEIPELAGINKNN